ncbi:MAG TPA: hypothetical protein VNO50_19625 [Pyrinomonadaceae bacterium]|nr:hypothetical protein [Pyrinomonadaceae bacterium]
MRRWIVLVLSALFFGSVSLIRLFFSDAGQGTIGFEVAKSLLQLGVVAVIGAVVSVLVFEYQRERQALDKIADLDRQAVEKKADLDRQALEKKRDLDRKSLEYREMLLLSILSRAMDAYGRAKKARRLLRGRAISTRDQAKVVLADQYDLCFDMLNNAQLDLENLARDVKTSAKAFSDPDALVTHLRSMDAYLNELIGEYEGSRSRFSGDEPSLPLRELQHLVDFLQKAKESKFMPEMVIPYHEVQKAIRGDLLHPNLLEST